MSFKNRAATTIAAGAASFALALGAAPLAGAQDAPSATGASGTGTISVPTDSALDIRIVVVDGKPTVMVSNGSQSNSNESGSNENDKPKEEASGDETEPTDGKKVTIEELEARTAGDWIDDYNENKKDGEKFDEFVDRVKADAEKGKAVEKGNDSTGTAVLDTETGEVRFKLSDLLSELGITPKGVDGTESRTDAENKANLDELAKLVDDGKVKFEEIPDFVEISGKNGITANTDGVKPGTYPITGTATDADGKEKEFKFEIKVEDTGKSGDSETSSENDFEGNETGSSETAAEDATNGESNGNSENGAEATDTNGENSAEGTVEDADSTESEQPSESESAGADETDEADETSKEDETDKDKAKSEASENQFYDDAEIRPGSSLTIKPKADAEGLVFMNAMNDEKWIDVKEDGTIDIEMSDGASEGDRDIYVAYAKHSDMAKVSDGDKSVIKLDKFTLTVDKDAKETEKETDATAKQLDEKVETMKKSLTDATNKLRDGSKSNGKSSSDSKRSSDKKSDGLYDDAEVEIGDSVTVSPNDAKDRVFAAVLLTTEDGEPIAEADNFPIDPMTDEISIDEEGEITIEPTGELLEAGDYTASVITSKPDNAKKFESLVEEQDLEGIVTTGEVHEFNVKITGDKSDDADKNGADAAAAQNGANGTNGAGGAGEQPAPQPQAQYDPQSEGSLAQTGVSLYAQLGLAASALALAGIAAVAMRRRGFAQ